MTSLLELFCDVDDFCQDFYPQWAAPLLKEGSQKQHWQCRYGTRGQCPLCGCLRRKRRLYTRALDLGCPTRPTSQCNVVADGAAWIWDIADDGCPLGQQVVDWFHAIQHLSEAAQAL